MNIEKTFELSIRLVLDSNAKDIIVAYSGGVDSHVLLHLVAKLRHEFGQHQYSAKHIHHGLNQYADQWAVHCQHICVELDFDFQCVRVDVDMDSNDGLEAAAREARYNALLTGARSNSAILLAQHADDQLETFILQLKRGAGPKGLSAMPVESKQANQIHLVRPFLAESKSIIGRKEIEQYATAKNLRWVEDDSNSNTRFERNFLRQNVLPSLTKRWPELSSAVLRSARFCAQQQQLLDEVVASKLAKMLDSRNRLNIQSLLQCTRLWQAQILRYWLDSVGANMPSEAVLTEIQQILLAREDANPIVNWHRWQIRRYQNYLYCLIDFDLQQPVNRQLNLAETIHLSDELGWICIENITGSELLISAEVKFGGYAVKFKPFGEKFTKPVKQWFQRWEIEPWLRQTIPLVFINNELAAILFSDKTVFAEKGTIEANEILQKSLKRGKSMPL